MPNIKQADSVTSLDAASVAGGSAIPASEQIAPPGTTQGSPRPATAGLLNRIFYGTRYVITGQDPNGWFSAGRNLAPVAQQQTQGRRTDYPTSLNTRYKPRAEEAISFSTLRQLGDSYDMLRLVIETRKDQMAALDWEIRMKDAKSEPDRARIAKIKKLFSYPDTEHDFSTWFRAIMEDLLVLDAPAVEPRFNVLGDLVALDWIDGASIKVLIDDYGRTPTAPDPAFQQYLKGVGANVFSRDQLIYKPRNRRTNKFYGYSPVEQVFVTVNIAIRRQVWQLQGYTEGNVPEAVVEMPENWTLEQVTEFQRWWDSLLEGNTAERRHMKFIPGPAKMTFTKPMDFKDQYDEWLARIICYAFSVSPQALVLMMNRATAETQKDMAMQEGLLPLMKWSKNFFDYIIEKYFGFDDIEFAWESQEQTDEYKHAQANDIYLQRGVISIDEVREELGKEPLGVPAGIMTTAGFVKLPTRENEEDAEEELETEDEAIDEEKSIDQSSGLSNTDLEGQKKAQLAKAKKKIIKLSQPQNDSEISELKGALASFLEGQKTQLADQAAALYDEHSDKIEKASKASRIAKQLDFSVWESLIPSLSKSIKDVMKKAGADVVAKISDKPDEIASMLNLVDEAAVEYASKRGAELVGKRIKADGSYGDNPRAEFAITETTRESIKGQITWAIEEGSSSGQLRDSIMQLYDFSESRADMIARTELGVAHSAGNMAAFEESGQVGRKRNILGSEHSADMPDEDICDESTEEGWIPLDSPFESGEQYPPHHPRCICNYEVELTPLQEEV